MARSKQWSGCARWRRSRWVGASTVTETRTNRAWRADASKRRSTARHATTEMTSPKRYWMTLVERDGPSALQPEFPMHPQPDLLASRRTFLKAAGFSFAGLMATNCRPAPQHALPHILQPELTPGRGYVYASTCRACEARCGLMVTTRDGRPTKIEGNPDHPLSGGATCAIGQASILGLYDSQRLAHPLK